MNLAHGLYGVALGYQFDTAVFYVLLLFYVGGENYPASLRMLLSLSHLYAKELVQGQNLLP